MTSSDTPRATAVTEVLLPVRIDLIGGWSDQLSWPHTAAVINASVGWHGGHNGGYPLRIRRIRNGSHRVNSIIPGVGTGLGISSILEAGKLLIQDREADYIQHVLEREQAEGTCGGWQDQIGAVASGLKLIVTSDHKQFDIKEHASPDVIEHIIIFDTGQRRRSKQIGDKVRELFATKKFVDALQKNVEVAQEVFDASPVEIARACDEGWQRLSQLVPGMDVDIPQHEMIIGHKLCGAGGGGYGVVFVDKPDNRDDVIEMFKQHGWWCTKPVLLPGIYHAVKN